jgi:starvation-inducible DNA-binding protein
MKPNIGIANNHLQSIAKLLNVLLADEFTLYAKTRNYHWNVTGPSFSEMHKFFEAQYEELDEMMDEVAERVRMLGHYSLGSLSAFSKNTRLTEGQDEDNTKKMVQNLLDDHETIIRMCRNDINTLNDKYKDAGNADFVTGIMKAHEKMAWMLRSYIE